MKMALHAADISNPAKPWAVSLKWTHCVLEEFFAQGDAEKERGLPVTPGFDREKLKSWRDKAKGQAFFIGVLVRPLYEALSKVPGMQLDECIENLDKNLATWKEVLVSGELPSGEEGGPRPPPPPSEEAGAVKA